VHRQSRHYDTPLVRVSSFSAFRSFIDFGLRRLRRLPSNRRRRGQADGRAGQRPAAAGSVGSVEERIPGARVEPPAVNPRPSARFACPVLFGDRPCLGRTTRGVNHPLTALQKSSYLLTLFTTSSEQSDYTLIEGPIYLSIMRPVASTQLHRSGFWQGQLQTSVEDAFIYI